MCLSVEQPSHAHSPHRKLALPAPSAAARPPRPREFAGSTARPGQLRLLTYMPERWPSSVCCPCAEKGDRSRPPGRKFPKGSVETWVALGGWEPGAFCQAVPQAWAASRNARSEEVKQAGGSPPTSNSGAPFQLPPAFVSSPHAPSSCFSSWVTFILQELEVHLEQMTETQK